MNRAEVPRAGQPRLCPMPGREVGGGGAEVRLAGLRLQDTAQQPSVGSSRPGRVPALFCIGASSRGPSPPPAPACHLFPPRTHCCPEAPAHRP